MSRVNEDLFLVLSKPPEGFPTRKSGVIGTCAMHALKALIEGYDPSTVQQVKAYARDVFSKISGFMLPFSVTRVLRKHHIPYETFSARGYSYQQKVNILKNKLKTGPILLLIANAYGSGENPSVPRSLLHWHYITLRGYDEKKQVFFIYDSNTKKRKFSNLPIGNSRFTYQELIRYRSIGATRIMSSYGIHICYNKKKVNQ